MNDQIIDARGAPLTNPKRYLEEFDNATMPVVDAEGQRTYLGLSKPELIALHVFARAYKPDFHTEDAHIERIARQAKSAAAILLKVLREPS